MTLSSPAEPSADVHAPKEHIKRPPNAWVLYRKVKSDEYREAHPGRKFTLPEMSGIMASQWAREPEEEIRRFEQLAREKKLEHRERHPDYKYQPRRRGPGDKQKKPRKVKEGRVTKPKRIKNEIVVNATDATTFDTTDTGHAWPVTNGPFPTSSDVFGLGSVVPVNDQRALTSSNHMFYDNTTISLQYLDNLIANMRNPTAQPMAYSDADSSHVAMQSFATSQVNAYQLMSNGGTLISNVQPHTGSSFQPFNAYDTLFEHKTETDVAAGLSESYATTSSQIDGNYDCFDCLEHSTPDFMYDLTPGNEQVFLDATANNDRQDLSPVFDNLADFLAFDKESITWGV